ncbi:MAG: recombinase family protein [Planctomycetota bacterium]|jgi:DNA invertase Pin-like site-specific DNA recombinase
MSSPSRKRKAGRKPRCAIYARAATGGSAAVDKQVRAAKQFLARRFRGGARVPPIKVYRDINSPGNNPPGPRLAALLADLAAGKIDLVVTADIVRLGRFEDRRDSVMASIEQAGARVMFFRDGRTCRGRESSQEDGQVRRTTSAMQDGKPKQHEVETTPAKRAAAYYRHSAREGNDVPISVQRKRVREFARKNGIEIIKEFVDRGRFSQRSKAFGEIVEDYVIGGKEEFHYVLVLDVDRWGRSKGCDLSAYYTGLCEFHGRRVVFVSHGFPEKGSGFVCTDPLASKWRRRNRLLDAMDERHGGNMKRIARIASRLLKSEKIEGRRKLLRQILDIARPAAGH